MHPAYDLGSLGEVANSWAGVFLPAFVKTSVLIALLLITLRFMRRTSASARHTILALGMAGTLLLPALEVIVPSWAVVPTPDVTWVGKAARASMIWSHGSARIGLPSRHAQGISDPSGSPLPTTPSAVGSRKSGEGPTTTGEVTASASAARRTDGEARPASLVPRELRLSFGVWCFTIWLAGVMVKVFSLIWATVRLDRMKRGARSLNCDGCPELLTSLCSEMGIDSPPLLLSSARVRTPMTWGVRRPVILLPEAWRRWSPAQRREVLLHEFAHIERRDCLTQLTSQVARLIFWVNPLVTVAARRMRIERERACDDRVLVAGIRPSSYAGNLLSIATRLGGRDRPMPAAVAMARRGGIYDRLDAVLDPEQRRTGPGSGFALAAATLILGAVTTLAGLGGCDHNRGIVHKTSWLSPTGSEVLTAEIRGDVTFSHDETAIDSMGADSYFALYTEGGRQRIRIEVRPDAGGLPVHTYRAGGRSRTFDEAARTWFAERLPRALKELAVNVEPRIQSIYLCEGANGVLMEVGRLTSDSARRKNLRAYFALTGLTQEETIRGLETAGGSVHSPYELSRLLEEVAPLAAGDEPVRQAYFAAADDIWSPHERVRLLSIILDRWMENEEVFGAAVTALSKVESGHEVACLLDSIGSDTDRSRVSQALASLTSYGE